MNAMDIRSPLCARHDGAMLGFLLYLCRFEFARERYPVFRNRMQHLLDGIAADVAMPESHDEFSGSFADLYEKVLYALTVKDNGLNRPLFRPFALGTGFLATALKMPNQSDAGMLKSIMDDLELPMALLESHAARVPEIGEKMLIDDVMSPALGFLCDLLLPLESEPETCFVAMPFSERFEEQYSNLYRPMMRDVGYRTLRAWGGLAAEFHVDLLLTLIDKSGALLAELTGLNPNVVFELGYAYGREKVVVPMADAAQPIAFANLYGLAILPYDSSKPGWRDDLLHGLGKHILQAMLHVAKGGAATSHEVAEPGP
jgi:hypothetical protein